MLLLIFCQHPGAKWQCVVGSSAFFLSESFATCCFLSFKWMGILAGTAPKGVLRLNTALCNEPEPNYDLAFFQDDFRAGCQIVRPDFFFLHIPDVCMPDLLLPGPGVFAQ